MKLFLLFVTFIITNFVSAQSNDFSVAQIDRLIKIIDSSKSCIVISGAGPLIVRNKKTRKIVRKGGFTDDEYFDTITKKLTKYEMAEYADSNEYFAYYFFDEKLIFFSTIKYAKTASSDNNKLISSGRFYFRNDILILKNEINMSGKIDFYIKRGHFLLDHYKYPKG